LAAETGICQATLFRWKRQALIDAGLIDGIPSVGINGGPQFTEAVSFEVRCADQDEVDYYWSNLVDGGEDRYGLSWQIVPERLYELVEGPDPARAAAATAAMLDMRKIVVAELEAAVG
jgi:predicted 3-demethylubiquinone-9 3-methyltransferase (glyoxalase superfamily)